MTDTQSPRLTEKLLAYCNPSHAQACTFLGVGPMSRTSVDATLEISAETSVPLMLIASRRQIDSEEFGGGYVENWTTQEFSDYVFSHSDYPAANVILARDHGGPWQNNSEYGLDLNAAMASAKRSYECDIDAGFEILHLDPSIDPVSTLSTSATLDRMFELYDHCLSYASKKNKKVYFEIGTEEQSGSTNTKEELEETLVQVQAFAASHGCEMPLFVVCQTGTRVMELRNVGMFESAVRVAGSVASEIQIPLLVDVCSQFGVMLKQHNTDYLSNMSLRWMPRLGIHAANVAPEFGVAETVAIFEIFEYFGKFEEAEIFEQLAVSSNKWEKWVIDKDSVSEREKALICGHYVFGNSEFIELRSRVNRELAIKGYNLEAEIKRRVRQAIMRYITNFGLLRSHYG